MEQFAKDVRGLVVEQAGHNIALEAPDELARVYFDVFAGR
jgi:hypothetical protein